MGKGSRTRKDYAEIQQRIAIEREIQQKKKRTKKIIIISVVSVFLAAAIICGSIFGIGAFLTNSGFYLRSEICLTSTDYKISNAQLSYFFELEYDKIKNQGATALQNMGLDTGKKLSSQNCSIDGFDNWYDYILSNAENSLVNAICYAQQAKKENIELDDEAKKSIDNQISSIEQAASDESKSADDYVSAKYGLGVKLSDVKECLELKALADIYYQKYSKTLDYTNAELDKAYKDNSTKYSVVDYVKYTVKSDTIDSTKQDEAEKLNAIAKNKAIALKNAKSVEEFNSIIKQYIIESYEKQNYDKTDSEIDDAVSNCSEYAHYRSDNSEFDDWAFSKAKVGQTFMDESEDGDSFDVYMLISKPYRQTYLTKNVRHILVSEEKYDDPATALTTAQDMLEDIRQSEDVEKTFIEYAKKYSEDDGSADNGGLYENIKQGEMVDRFDDWCFYSGRKPGDIAIVSTEYGYHVMYFVGNGVEEWKVKVIDDCKLKSFEELVESLKKEFNVKFDDSVARKLEK